MSFSATRWRARFYRPLRDGYLTFSHADSCYFSVGRIDAWYKVRMPALTGIVYGRFEGFYGRVCSRKRAARTSTWIQIPQAAACHFGFDFCCCRFCLSRTLPSCTRIGKAAGPAVDRQLHSLCRSQPAAHRMALQALRTASKMTGDMRLAISCSDTLSRKYIRRILPIISMVTPCLSSAQNLGRASKTLGSVLNRHYGPKWVSFRSATTRWLCSSNSKVSWCMTAGYPTKHCCANTPCAMPTICASCPTSWRSRDRLGPAKQASISLRHLPPPSRAHHFRPASAESSSIEYGCLKLG